MSDLKLTTAFVVSQTLTKFVTDAFTKLSSRIIKKLATSTLLLSLYKRAERRG